MKGENEEKREEKKNDCNKILQLVLKSKEKVCWNSQNARVKVMLNNDKSNERRKGISKQ